jgi:hypothetical protein
VSIDRTRGKIRGLIDSHRLNEWMTTELQESEGIDCFRWLITRCYRYSDDHQEVCSRPYEESQVKGSRDPPATQPLPKELSTANEKPKTVEGRDSSSTPPTNGFRVATAESFGWGIYK